MGIFNPMRGKNDSEKIQISTITGEMETIKVQDDNLSMSVKNEKSIIRTTYNKLEEKILQTLEAGGIVPRPEASSGFWLGPLIGLCGIATYYCAFSPIEILLLMKLTGIGLLLSSICLIIQLLISESASKNFQLLYLIPVGITSVLYFLYANKGLITSVSWGLSVGSLGTWGVLQIMSKFPKGFTLGEGITVTHGILLFLLSNGATNPLREVIPPGDRDALSLAVWQFGIFIVGLHCLLYAFIPRIRSTYYFFSLAVGLLIIHFSPWIYLIGLNSYHFIYYFAISSRIPMIIYWAVCLLLGTIVITYQVLSKSRDIHAARWTFIFFAALISVPGLSLQPRLLHLVSGILMGLFIVFELIRFLFESPPKNVESEEGCAEEEKCSLPFSPLHFYLGIAFPLWMHIISDNRIARLSGVITIAVGDTAARIGNKWGKWKYPSSNKTVEGTLACIISQLLCICLCFYSGYAFARIENLLLYAVLVMGLSLVQTWTDQVATLVLPFLFYLGCAFFGE